MCIEIFPKFPIFRPKIDLFAADAADRRTGQRTIAEALKHHNTVEFSPRDTLEWRQRVSPWDAFQKSTIPTRAVKLSPSRP